MVGSPYQTAVRLSATAASNWQAIDGVYSGKGVDLFSLPLSRFLSVVYVWALEHMEEDEGRRWQEELKKPLPGQAASMGDDADELPDF